jgi:deoxyribose-phosphate aldolase
MSRERDELVEQITRQVLAALKRGPAAGAAGAEPAAPPRDAAAWRAAHDVQDPATAERYELFGVSTSQSPEHTRALHEAGAARVVATTGYCPASDGLASLIDHTLLKPDATRADIEKICAEAAQFGFASVCVNPVWVPHCRDLLKGSCARVCTVIGFPSGAHAPDVKAYEARRAVEQGAEEVDMVINIGALKSKDFALVEQDIRGVVQAAQPNALVKVILETSLLTREEKIMGCSLAKAAGADFVKTSTGFAGGGATVEDIHLMRETVGPEMGVKASGGVRTKEEAEAMVAAGATRIGASAGVKIVRGGAPAGADGPGGSPEGKGY